MTMFNRILQKLTPGAKYSFQTKQQTNTVTKPGQAPVEVIENIPIYDSYDAIIWNDGVIEKPTLAQCESAWQEIQGADQEIMDKLSQARDRLDIIDILRLLRDDLKNGTTKFVEYMDTLDSP